MHTNVLQDIKKLQGMEEFKKLTDKLQRIANNRSTLFASQIRLPNYLFAVAPGCGATTYLHLMTKLLDELNLVRFEGERKCFEWIIDSEAFERNNSFDRLLNHVKSLAGFRSAFYGVAGIDIDDWCNNPDSPKLNRLLDFCEDMQGQILFVFFVNLDKQDKLPAIVERLSREMPLELVRFPMPSSDELVLTLAYFMLERGFSFSRESMDYLKTIMPRFVSIKHFDGFQTLENLADEIIYSYCSKEEVSCPYITKEDLLFIEQPNGYLERIGNSQMRTTNHRRIGFDARRDKQ